MQDQPNQIQIDTVFTGIQYHSEHGDPTCIIIAELLIRIVENAVIMWYWCMRSIHGMKLFLAISVQHSSALGVLQVRISTNKSLRWENSRT